MKNKLIFCGAQSLYGDIVSYLPFLNYIEKCYPNSIKIYSLAKKCWQMSLFLLNHKQINQIKISGPDEGLDETDFEIIEKCDFMYRINPPISRPDWYNYHDLRREVFLMYGASIQDFENLSEEERYPKLEQWFSVERHPKTIAIWAKSGYNTNDPSTMKRSPSNQFWHSLYVDLINLGYKVAQLGFSDIITTVYPVLDLRNLSLFESIKFALGCDINISTDSGSAWILGGYGVNQIVLYSMYRDGHINNPMALVPVNNRDRLIAIQGKPTINDIDKNLVLEKIKDLNN
jgi:hypothetical protein